MTEKRYYATIDSIDVFCRKHNSYGTIIFLPPEAVIDFGEETWPQPDNIKKSKCPRVLMVSTWMDNKFGLVGGAKEADESPVQTMNREFYEEMGTCVEFKNDDHIFSSVNGNRATHVYAKVTRDLEFFNSLMCNFYRDDRNAYLDEVLSVVALPIWIEGPSVESIADDNVWGLPRFLMSNGAVGCFSSGRFKDVQDTTREEFLLLLLATGVITPDAMSRIARLTQAKVFTHSPIKVKDFNELCQMNGVIDVIRRHGHGCNNI